MPLPHVTLLLAVIAQGPRNQPKAPPAPVAAVAATRAVQPPVIDGRDDDQIWRNAAAITDFREARPTEDAIPAVRTSAKIAYDARNLYVFVRNFDPHPDSIVSLLARRDVFTPSDMLWLEIDSYHDRRSAFEFAVNPAGVKLDAQMYNDGDVEDFAWDAVWEVATTIDSLGWTAEFRIPLSQLRYAVTPSNTFGFAILRDIERTGERVSWPVYHRSHAGFVSQLGEITGLDSLSSPHRPEITPYFVTKNVTVPSGTGFGRDQQFSVGGDIKVPVASNLTLNATANPDFGQVEADPSVLNLTAFQSYFQERRPFFVEGTGLFQVSVNCSAVNCSNEGLFYSRRIGRSPQLSDLYGDANSAQATTILGAAKLTGRLPSGLSIGALEAVTQRETGAGGATVEPGTNYAALRANQDLKGGESALGLMVTAVNRNLDAWSSPLLARTAYVAALDFRHRFLNHRYEVSGSLDVSQVAGSRAAMDSLQTNPVHYYQRPDGPLHYDTTRTSLGGSAQELKIGKVGGGITRFETSYLRRSAGFEVNDLGFLQQADQQSWNNWFAFRFFTPTRVYRQLNWNFNWWQFWSAAGLSTERAANTNVHAQLNNHMWIHAGGTVGQLGTTFCDRCARGGPALRVDPYVAPWAGLQGDDRHAIIPYFWVNYWQGDGGRSHSLNLQPELDGNFSTRVSGSVSVNYTRNHNNSQWYGYVDTASVRHYTVAVLDQRTVGITARVNYTVTPALSMQLYAQPFISKGTYANVREISNPHAAAYGDRYSPFGAPGATSGFNVKDFNSSFVLRWEYRPGSTLFVVWTQARSGSAPAQGQNGMGGDLRDLFRLYPYNTFLVKLSYWLSR